MILIISIQCLNLLKIKVMNAKKFLFIFILFWISSLSLSAQVLVSVNQKITKDTIVATNPRGFVLVSKTVNASGSAEFASNYGFVRILLSDDSGFDLLIYESSPLFAKNGIDNFSNISIEAVDISANHTFTKLRVEIENAELKNLSIVLSAINPTPTQMQQARADRIVLINSNLRSQNALWAAGETSVSELSYEEKKGLFGGKVPDLQGFEYYVGGIFELHDSIKTTAPDRAESNYVSSFDWRDRHSANNPNLPNYYNTGGKGWLTPAKHQGNMGLTTTCAVFSVVGAVEALINLYYNQYLNKDLSEQEIISCCTPESSGTSWHPDSVIKYIETKGVCDENCFPHWFPHNWPCSYKCLDPDENIKINGSISLTQFPYLEEALKYHLIKYGPLVSRILQWEHGMVILGWKVIQEGDTIHNLQNIYVTIPSGDSRIGQTAWILKNSHGTDWGSQGFAYMLPANLDYFKHSYALLTPIDMTVKDQSNNIYTYTVSDITCEDKDGDGYYYWGIGPKPPSCPCESPEEPDGDDSNPNLGPMDEFGFCTAIVPQPIPIVISSDQYISQNTTMSVPYDVWGNITIQPGATLTIKNTVFRIGANKQIIIRPGGKLIVNNSKIRSYCSDSTWQGIYVVGDRNLTQTPQNQGVLELIDATIANADTAIYTGTPNNNWDYTGGIIQATNTVFYNNLRSVNFLNYQNKYGIYENNNVSYFTNCTFTVKNSIIGNFVSHVKLNAVKGITFNGCSFDNQTGIPDFGKGIFAESANFTVNEYCPQQGNCDCATTPIRSNFENFYTGVEVLNSGTNYSFNVRTADFKNNKYSIKTDAINSFQISKNYIALDCNATEPYGVYTNNSTSYKVDYNNFITLGNPNFCGNSTAVQIINSGTNENLIYKNFIVNNFHGITTIGTNGTNTTTGTGLKFYENTFANNFYDVYIDGSICLNQGNSTNGANNIFYTNGYTNDYYNIYNSSSNPNLNYFYHYNSVDFIPPFTENVNLIPSTHLHIIHHFPIHCMIAPAPIYTEITITPNGNQLNDLMVYSILQFKHDSLITLYDSYGYEKLLSADSIDATNPRIIAARQMQSKILDINFQMAEIADFHLYKILNDSIFDRSLLNDWYNAINTLSAKYALTNSYAEVGNFRYAYSVLSEIEQSFQLDSLQQIEHNNFRNFLYFKADIVNSGRNWTELTSREISQLITIRANTNGLSSSYANGILCFFYNDCQDPEYDRSKAKSAKFTNPENENPIKTNSQIHIYPNPTTSTAEIINTNHETKIVKVEILSITGQTLQTFSTAPSNNLQINLSKLNTGLYFVKTLLDNNQEFIDKIVKE